MASPGLCCVKRVSDICILESMIGVSSKNLMVMTCEPRFDRETTLEIVYSWIGHGLNETLPLILFNSYKRVVFTSSIGAVYMNPNRDPQAIVD
ncbi:hypothetical protein YC2023_091524 [Brassica napus]